MHSLDPLTDIDPGPLRAIDEVYEEDSTHTGRLLSHTSSIKGQNARSLDTSRRQISPDTFDWKPLDRDPDGETRPAEPGDYSGDEEFRDYKERVGSRIIRLRPDTDPETGLNEQESCEVKEEKSYPREGKTRIPGRIVNKRAITELGYPFEEEVSIKTVNITHIIPDCSFSGRGGHHPQGFK